MQYNFLLLKIIVQKSVYLDQLYFISSKNVKIMLKSKSRIILYICNAVISPQCVIHYNIL